MGNGRAPDVPLEGKPGPAGGTAPGLRRDLPPSGGQAGRPAPAARPAGWYRSWRFYLTAAAAVLIFAYGWQVTQIRLGELWRGAHLIEPFVVALASPDVVVREPIVERAEAPFTYGGPAAAPAAPSTPVVPVSPAPGPGPVLRLSPPAGKIGDRVTASGEAFPPNRQGMLWWENQIGQRQQLGAFATDAGGRFSLAFQAPEVQGTRNTVIAEVTTGAGPLRASQTLTVVTARMVETVFLALMGTAMGIVFAVPLSFLGARNLVRHIPAGGVVYGLVRAVFNITRSIEALVLAIIFTVWVGLGPFAGVLALGVHSIASLGKLYSEAIESIDAGPIEAVMSTGASPLQVIRYAVVPQIVPQFLAFTIYRWDINVRFSTVIGFVGGGGIGFVLQQYINLLQWRQAATALWMIAIVVAVLDYASAVVRERLV